MSRLPEDQLKQLREIFTRFDLDKDGSLTHLEVAALLRSLGLKPTGDQIHKLFNHMDSDGSGTVEFDELVNSMSSQMMTDDIIINQQELLEIFKSFDRDGSGFITPAELAKSMTKMGQPLTYRELSEMVRDADTDGDGQISFTEFQRIMARSAAESLGFTDSFKTSDGQVFYGFATFKGMWVFDYQTAAASGSGSPDLRKYKLRAVDWIHAFVSAFVLVTIAMRDRSVVSCFYPRPSHEAQEVLDIVPLGLGLVCSLMFRVCDLSFQNTRYWLPGLPLMIDVQHFHTRISVINLENF
ncbi:hypothetical protein E3N88_39301 [Mikania micrantha]|uniref:EF-hand domain-containing protein n=1 Tax=Mikania micrantha TaxID=192012 RepID=A0A5N6LWD3_9ASTR|nr:hypothetical protein E3N88_39301 [Mikania micrantha]